MDAQLQAAAWGALSQAWAWRWALILGIGSGPLALSWLMRKTLNRDYVSERAVQLCALVAALLCIYSLKLAGDTYLLESQSPEALVKTTCPRADTRTLCVQSRAREANASVQAVDVWTLQYSGTLVAVRPSPSQ